MRVFPILFVSLVFAGCTHLTMTPNTLDTDAIIYVDRGGHQMLPIVKDVLTKRGYNVTVGEKRRTAGTTYIESSAPESVMRDRARYVVSVKERRELFAPIPCLFHGLWWWKYDVSISDNKTGTEILNWSSRNCAGLAEWRFNNYLDKLEIQK